MTKEQIESIIYPRVQAFVWELGENPRFESGDYTSKRLNELLKRIVNDLMKLQGNR